MKGFGGLVVEEVPATEFEAVDGIESGQSPCLKALSTLSDPKGLTTYK